MFNKVILVGNLTRDPELRYTPSGTAVTNFGIATNRRWGEDKEEVFFGEVNAWGKLAEICEQYLKKGSQCLVEGRLKTEQWEYEGKKMSKTRIVADNIRFLGGGKGSDSGSREESIPEEETRLEPF